MREAIAEKHGQQPAKKEKHHSNRVAHVALGLRDIHPLALTDNVRKQA